MQGEEDALILPTSPSHEISSEYASEPTTPACAASDAAGTFSENLTRSSPSTPSRHPSLLLQHYEHHATPRQRKLMLAGMSSPDRFLASRSATPTKQGLILTWADVSGKPVDNIDPFAPSVRRTVRIAEQYATLRAPVPPLRPVGTAGTRVRDAQAVDHQRSHDRVVWSVGGTAVTEGILSSSNGRGGRVTSGTSAPHYGADFLRRRSQTDEQITHGRRLAYALDISQTARMVDRTSPTTSPNRTSSPATNGGFVERVQWRDGKWTRPLGTSCPC